MGFSNHLRLLGVATLGWLIFVLLGWPQYYQNWDLGNLIRLCVVVYFTLGLALYWLIDSSKGSLYMRGFWVGFYASVPLMIYDYVYIQHVLEVPFELFNSFWYLSVFYIVPWIQIAIVIISYKVNSDRPWRQAMLGIVLIGVSLILRSKWATFEGSFFDTMSDYPERNITMLESALKYALFGTFLSAGGWFIFRSGLHMFKRED